MLKRVSELPDAPRGGKRESYAAKDVREFCRNTLYDVAEITIEGKKPNGIAMSARRYIKRHPDQCKGVNVTLRSGKCYLYREVPR